MDNRSIYEEFDWKSLHFCRTKRKDQKIIEWIPKDVNSIVDIGCGNGTITNILDKAFEITGIDRSKAALEYVETRKILSDANNIPLEDGSFDMSFSSKLLEHLEDDILLGTVSELKRLSRKYIFITVSNHENPDKLSIQCPNCNYCFNRPNHLRSFTSKSLI